MVKFFSNRRFIDVILLLGGVVAVVSIVTLLALETRAFEGFYRSAPSKPEPEPEKKPEPEPYKPPAYLDAPKNSTARQEKLAYVTFLSATDYSGDDLENDNYFLAVRILVWQLKHVPETRTTKYDVVVMVTPGVSQSRRDRLQKDGAIVHPVEFLRVPNDDWIYVNSGHFKDVMAKLRAWEMTQYDRILMLDGDSMMVRQLDKVFDDPGAQLLSTKENNESLPSTYLLGSNMEVWDSSHEFPPKEGSGLKDIGNFNAGFFMLAPSLEMFEYYKTILATPDSFDPLLPEQNLMNYAHRWNGPMPWREVAYTWNIRYPTDADIEKGVVSVHEKWWSQPLIYENAKTKQWLLTRRWEMKGWYDAHEAKPEKSTRATRRL